MCLSLKKLLCVFYLCFAFCHTTLGQEPAEPSQTSDEQLFLFAKSIVKRPYSCSPSDHGKFTGSNENLRKKYVAEIQRLSERLHVFEPEKQAIIFRAISHLSENAGGVAFSAARERYESNQLSDEAWVDVLSATSEILPARKYPEYLKSLEDWERKSPFHISKLPPKGMFRPFIFRALSPEFLDLAAGSENPTIAGYAIENLIRLDRSSYFSLRKSAERCLTSKNQQRLIHGIELRADLHPGWSGKLEQLRQFTENPDKRVAGAAATAWVKLRGQQSSADLLVAIKSDSRLERFMALSQIDSETLKDWGASYPLTHLLSSDREDVKRAAIRAISRIGMNATDTVVRRYERETSPEIRQLLINEMQPRDWSQPYREKFAWSHLGGETRFYPMLAQAERDGLEADRAWEELTEPFGRRCNALFEQLESEDVPEGKTLTAIGKLLDQDPSLQATEFAVQTLREIIAKQLERNTKGSLGQSSTARKLLTRHANRLAPIVGDLCQFIEQTNSSWVVKTLPSFGVNAKPALGFMIRILEDKSGDWKDNRFEAIATIRAMQHHGKPALPVLLQVARSKEYLVGKVAAVTYLDLGGNPEELMPDYATFFPVLVKIDPAELVKSRVFTEALKNSLDTQDGWLVVHWLGPHAKFLVPEIKRKLGAVTPFISTYDRDLHRMFVQLLPQLPSPQKEFVPICVKHLKGDGTSRRLDVGSALQILTAIGDDQRLAESSVASLLQSDREWIRTIAKDCYEKLYAATSLEESEESRASEVAPSSEPSQG